MQAELYRARVSDGSGFDFVLSDGSMDRHGTRINPNGWDLGDFKRNPIALFAHNTDAPIGTWDNIRVESGKLIASLKMAAAGTSQRIDEMRSLVEQGILRAVSVGFRVLAEGKPGKSEFDFDRQTLLEASLVSVPSNVNALAKARSLKISNETMSLAFGEQAETRRDVSATGEQAATSRIRKNAKMSTLSQRIEDAQNDLVAKRDKLTELNGMEELDLDAIEELNGQVEKAERTVSVLKQSEARIGINAGMTAPAATGLPAPAVSRRPLGMPQRELNGFDLIVRAMTVRGIAHFGPGNKSIERVLDEQYPGHEATHAFVTRADQTVGTTGTAGWASELVATSYADYMDSLLGKSIYPELANRGQKYSFDGAGTVSIPYDTGTGAGGGFVAEGAPIRVGRITTAATTVTARKMGVIVPFTRELAKRSRPSIEGLVRRKIIEQTSVILDAAVLDATAGDTARPAGLLNGVSATASGYGGGDFTAVIADFKALLAPFTAANAADNITVILNPAQGLALSMMPGPGDGRFGWAEPLMSRMTILESTHATANRIIAIRNSDLATASGDAPEFDISEQATIHMEDAAPLEIVSGTGPTAADPVRSLWQTGSVGVRMLLEVTWKMTRSGMVAWIDGTSW